MKKIALKSLLFLLPVTAMVSCKPSLTVSSDYDRTANFNNYKTYGMYYLVTSQNINQLNEERIWNSIRTEMAKKGYIEDNKNPDLLVNAMTVIKDKKYISATATGYGYGGIYRPYGYWGAPRSATIRAEEYKQGSLVIDVVDTKTNKLVWQGTGSAEFEKKPKNPDEVINTTVNKILVSLPQVNGTVKK